MMKWNEIWKVLPFIFILIAAQSYFFSNPSESIWEALLVGAVTTAIIVLMRYLFVRYMRWKKKEI